MYRIVLLSLSSFLFLGCSENHSKKIKLPYYNESNFTPNFIEDKSIIEDKITHQIANFSLYNQDSILLNQKTIEGKIHIANFIFTSCGSICPTMTRNMKIVSDSLANDSNLVILSYTVTPWIDRPSVLKNYKVQNAIHNPHWHFLTGTTGEIYKLARQSYFAEEDLGFTKDSTEFLHTEHVLLVDKTKRIRGIYNGTLTLEMNQLIEDIKTLEKLK